MPKTQTPPVYTPTRRRNVQGALWANQDGKGRNYYVATITRSYKDGDEWKDQTLRVPLDDIPRIIAVLQELETKAYVFMEGDFNESKRETS